MPSIGALMTLPCGAAAFGEFIPPEPYALETLQEVYDREAAVYEDAGLREVRTGVARVGEEINVTLEGGQCIGVVTASAAPWPVWVTLMPTEGEHFNRADRTHVSSVAWCDPFATRMRIVMDNDWQRSLDHTAQSMDGTIHYRIFMGRTDAFDLSSLPRGIPNAERVQETLVRMRTDQAIITERANLPDDEILDAVRVARPQGALMIPLSDATYTSYREAITLFTRTEAEDVFPRTHHASVGEVETDVTVQEGIVRIDGVLHRVLAVVDPGDLPVEGRVPCARIRFGRLGTAENIEVRRFDLQSDELIAVEGVAASDTMCPTDGIRLYVAPIIDAHDYMVRLFRAEGPDARRRTSDALAPPVYPPFVEARDACQSTGERCLEAAREARDGAHIAVDNELAETLLERACAENAQACGEFAEFLLSQDKDSEAAEVLDRACTAEKWVACARLGDLRRLGRGVDADYDIAHQLYTRACTHEVNGACSNASALNLMNLTSNAAPN